MPPPESGKDPWEEELRKLKQEVQKLLEECGLTQTDLAQEAGVGQPLVSKLVSGRRISRKMADKLAGAVRRRNPDFEWDERPDGVSVYGYCASTGCPSLCLAFVDRVVYVAPKFRRLTRSMRDDCPYCESPICSECPNCNAPISDRLLNCPACNKPYVADPAWVGEIPPEELAGKCEMINRMNAQLRRHLGDEA